MGQKHPEAGCLHRAVFPNRMTEQPAVTQKVLRTKGLESRGEARQAGLLDKEARAVNERRARENGFL